MAAPPDAPTRVVLGKLSKAWSLGNFAIPADPTAIHFLWCAALFSVADSGLSKVCVVTLDETSGLVRGHVEPRPQNARHKSGIADLVHQQDAPDTVSPVQLRGGD